MKLKPPFKTVEIDDYLSKEERLKKKLVNKFIKKPRGHVTLNLKNGTKLRIEYMYGARYALMKKAKGVKKPSLILINVKIDKIVERIYKERDLATSRIKKKEPVQLDIYSIHKYMGKK